MHRHWLAGLAAVFAVAIVAASGCAGSEVLTGEVRERQAGLFATPQDRWEHAVGADRHTSTHFFEALADGGRIELQRDVDDPAIVDKIRRHLVALAEALASGDFGGAAFVHAREIPGAAVMAAERARIEYVYRDLPRGGELRLVTSDPEAIRAIHEFIAFHQAGHPTGRMNHGAQHHGTRDHGVMHERRNGGHPRRGDAP